jgi:Glycosyl hydrolase family 12
MSGHRRPRKLVQLAVALGLMAVAALGGYAVAEGHTPTGGRLAETANVSGASGGSLTLYACLAGGKLTQVSTTAPKCSSRSSLVQWTAQTGPAAAPTPSPAKSSSSPSMAPSTPSASPSTIPASSAPPATTGNQGTACVTSDGDGGCGPYSSADISGSGGSQTYVIQDIWNQIKGATQTLTAFGPGNWSVKASLPASNTAVVADPDTQQIYTTDNDTPNPLSGYSSITSSYTESGPSTSGDDWEAAYDIWAGTGSNNYAQEIMIWVDNHGQAPAGSVVGSATIDGQGYKIWSTGKAGTVGNPVSMVLDSNQASGSVNVLDDMKWLESNGYVPAGSGLNQVDFGFELCSTGGTSQTFAVSQFGLKATCTSGSSCTNGN